MFPWKHAPRWQYMAERDAPVFMDKILSETNHSKVYIVGSSMGTTVMFSMLSENHNYDDKVSLIMDFSATDDSNF